ncbi:MAG: hypothetical protein H6872_08135 [Methylobacteriaceae bacterium]|nr:hypothetical protein [Methylobacteriaceae bacterium]
MNFIRFLGRDNASNGAARSDSIRNRIVMAAAGLVAALALASALTANWYSWQGARRRSARTQ